MGKIVRPTTNGQISSTIFKTTQNSSKGPSRLAPAVNRQPGYRREPRRASCVFELKEYVRITQVVNQGCRWDPTLYELRPQPCGIYHVTSMCVQQSFVAARWLEKHRKYIEHGQTWTQAKLRFKVVSSYRHAMNTTNTRINVTDDST